MENFKPCEDMGCQKTFKKLNILVHLGFLRLVGTLQHKIDQINVNYFIYFIGV